jgi:hypothetical protein
MGLLASMFQDNELACRLSRLWYDETTLSSQFKAKLRGAVEAVTDQFTITWEWQSLRGLPLLSTCFPGRLPPSTSGCAPGRV